VRAWQTEKGMEPDGYCSANLLSRLRAQQGH